MAQHSGASNTTNASPYVNTVEYVVSALCAQAHAAHLRGNAADKPFTVSISSVSKPWLGVIQTYFTVRDFGPGYTEEDIAKMYGDNQEGANNVDSTVDLATNAPLRYTGAFSALSTKGVETVSATVSYDLDIAQTNVETVYARSMKRMSPNGLEVSFPLEAKDIAAFEAAARALLPQYNAVLLKDDVIVAEFKNGDTATPSP